MINADEHKKLLAQIAELEKNSVNYFDVEKEFFLIDSDNLLQVRSKLYGYSIQRTGIYEDDNLTPEAIAGLDGRGCYVYVEAKDDKITIKQDLNGCWGIYLFRHGDYFALSNSFFRLLDHVKFKYPLTVNRDYINHNLLAGIFLNFACSETAVNEIRLVDRSAILYIDATRKQLDVELIDYKEHTRSLDSAEGIATLDHWVEFWANAFSSIAQRTKFIQADLSGGFDSRVSLVPVLHSGIALNKIRVYSIKDDLHTHREDYEIAYKIASHYGFKLNQALPERKNFSLGLSDVWNLDFYVRQTATKDPALFWTIKNIQRLYSINGNAGETIRHRWHGSPKEFMEELLRKFYPYSKSLSDKMLHSMRNIFESSFSTICNKYKIKDKNSEEILQFLYQETWSRHHFGKGATCDYFKNRICLSPVLDPEVRTLRLNTPECPDANLLIALLFTRYEPDLLIFPFEGNNSIASETIAYAKKINERFPRRPKDIATVIGGGILTCNRVTKKQKKFFYQGTRIRISLRTFYKII
ncbi:MAG: hypothetical protein II968_08595 [Selenomonadaceae bacterium]|nr:hypothetical protein [Selenomonadaceae bacterium]